MALTLIVEPVVIIPITPGPTLEKVCQPIPYYFPNTRIVKEPDQVLVRVSHSRADLPEKPQPFFRRELVTITVEVYRLPFGVLHDEAGQAVLARPAVQQARYVRVLSTFQPSSEMSLALASGTY